MLDVTRENLPFALRRFSPAQLKEALRKMYLIRRFEEGAEDSYMRGLIHGTMHLSIGQEASAVGVCLALEDDDQITSTHRGHGHCIAKGADVGRMFAEFFGKETGYCKGRGGSMHIADVSRGNLGANGIVGGGLPISVGAALSAKRLNTGKVVACFFGDGANNEGAFHESLNMAAVWTLPVVFVCENNKYGMSVSTERSTAVASIAARAAAYGIPGVSVDGNDLSAVAEAVDTAVRRARAGGGPSLIEAVTYRWRGHSKSDRNRYRTKEEIAEWMAKDPIARFAAVLQEHGVLSAAEHDALVKDVDQAIAAGIAFAKASPEPDLADATRDVYTPVTVVAAADAEHRPAPLKASGTNGTDQTTSGTGTRELSYAEAIREALDLALAADERVVLLGEDIGVYGGAFQVTGDLVHRYGEDRVMDTPISELGGAGVAVGAALTGMRPVFELQFSDFATLAMEQIVNQAAKLRYMLGGAVSVPMVVRLPSGSGTGAAAQHSQSLEAWFAHIPGLKVVQPTTPHDAKGLLLAAIADPDPVIMFEHKLLYKTKGPVPEGHYTLPIGKAAVRRVGRDVTIAATGIMVPKALIAAETLSQEGIEAEVLDLRTLRPLDLETIFESVRKTSRLACVYEGVKMLGIGAEISARVAESDVFDLIDAPIVRLGGADAPIPYNPRLEAAVVPQVPDIIAAVRAQVSGRA